MMERLLKRADEVARAAQRRRIGELARSVADRLPDAEIKLLTDGFSVSDVLLLERWLDDPELRFLGRQPK